MARARLRPGRQRPIFAGVWAQCVDQVQLGAGPGCPHAPLPSPPSVSSVQSTWREASHKHWMSGFPIHGSLRHKARQRVWPSLGRAGGRPAWAAQVTAEGLDLDPAGGHHRVTRLPAAAQPCAPDELVGLTLPLHSKSWAPGVPPSLPAWVRGLLNDIPLHSNGNEFGFSEHTPAGWGGGSPEGCWLGKGKKREGRGGSQAQTKNYQCAHSRVMTGHRLLPTVHPPLP